MRLRCPSCGAMASLEAWSEDGEARAALVAVCALPGGLPGCAPRYLGLFRKPSSLRGLSWGRAKALIEELGALAVAKEIVWDTSPALPNQAEYWRAGIEQLLERDGQGKIKRPLNNHNLLRCIAYEIADKEAGLAAKQAEALRRYPIPDASTTAARMEETLRGRARVGKNRAREILQGLRERQENGNG